MTTYKTFADLATAIGPVLPTTKETQSEYGPAIDPIPSQAPTGPKVWVRHVLEEQTPEDYGDRYWKDFHADFANWLVAGSLFFEVDERSEYDRIQFIDKVLQGLERMRDTAEDAGHQTKEEIGNFDRLDSGTEIDIERYRSLQERLRLLRRKWFRANKAFEAGLLARSRAISQTGRTTFNEYMSLERLAGQHRLKKERERRDFAAMKAAEKLLGLPEEDFRALKNRMAQRLLDTTLDNLAGGIDADDGKGAGLAKIERRPSPSERLNP